MLHAADPKLSCKIKGENVVLASSGEAVDQEIRRRFDIQIPTESMQSASRH